MASRYYKHPSGCDVPSVTTITGQLEKPALTYWAANCACDYIAEEVNKLGLEAEGNKLFAIFEAARKNWRNVSKTALDTGSRIHDAIEQYFITGKEPFKPSEQVLSGFLAFLEWKDANKVELIATEHTVYGYDFAGTLDLLCNFNGKKYVIDYKSSKGIYDEMRYQVAGYRSTFTDVEGCGILRLDKESGYPEWVDTSDTYQNDLLVFNTLTSLWYLRNPKKREQFINAQQKERVA
jgi:hypothetical protein